MRLIRARVPAGTIPGGSVVTIGKFDGLHRGHREVIATAATVARERRLPLVVVSFEPLPDEYFAGGEAPARLARFVSKWRLLAGLGTVDAFACLRFDRGLASQEPEVFAADVLANGLGARHVVVGEEFRFGRRRRGDVALLADAGRRHGFTVTGVPPVAADGQRISSSRVRAALEEHRLDDAASLLGRPYRVWGRVVTGDRLGRRLGFPTANLALGRRPPPLAGIYVVRATGTPGGPRHGMANVGDRPTVAGRRRLLEVYFPGFDGDLYGRALGVDFLARLRPEERFTGLDALTATMREDVAAGGRWLRARGLDWRGTDRASGNDEPGSGNEF